MQALTIIVSGLLALLFLYTGLSKEFGAAQSIAFREHLEIPPAQWRLIGVLELAGALGVILALVLRPLGVAAAVGLVVLTLGAIATHRRAGDPPRAALPAAVGLALAAASALLLIAEA